MPGFKNRNAIVVGCGGLGSALASALSRSGWNVTAIDMREEAFEGLDDDYDGETLTGDGGSSSVLEECGIRQAGLLAAVTDHDATNLLVAELASEIYNVERVIPRIEDESLLKILEDMNVSPICPHLVCMEQLAGTIGLRQGKGALR